MNSCQRRPKARVLTRMDRKLDNAIDHRVRAVNGEPCQRPMRWKGYLPREPGPYSLEVVDELGVDKQVESNKNGQFANDHDLKKFKYSDVYILQIVPVKENATNYHRIIYDLSLPESIIESVFDLCGSFRGVDDRRIHSRS